MRKSNATANARSQRIFESDTSPLSATRPLVLAQIRRRLQKSLRLFY